MSQNQNGGPPPVMPSRVHRFWLCAAVLLAAGVIVAAWQVFPITLSPRHSVTLSSPPSPPAPTPGLPWFEDVTAASGIDFRHFDGATPMHYIQETMGSGLGWIDFNRDGWPDLFCVQGGPVRPGTAAEPPPTNKLYRNNSNGTFTDITEAAGLARTGFGMGCAVGDFDNDGFDDLVVTYMGGVVLYRNAPGGPEGRQFVDVTAKAGIHNPHWATSCAWGDLDGDGFLDLYVCNYLEADLDKHPVCEDQQTRVRFSCPPTLFPNVKHRLYRNNGDGTFTDISARSGIAAAPPAPGLGVVLTDLDGDGLVDIYVANDLRPAYLFHNQGDGRFTEKALLQGCGLGPHGQEVAGMGVEAGDLDGTGRQSLFVTNFQGKPNVLYRNGGRLVFQECGNLAGLAAPSLNRLGFGTVFFDADGDGHLDIAVANGHIHRTAEEVFREPFAQEAQLFLGNGKGRFRDVSARAGEYFRRRYVGRGLASADYDNDGRPDLAFSHNGGPIVLLHNRTANDNRWIRFELIGDGTKSNRNAVGSRVEVECGGGKQVRFVNGGGSYLSASERRLLVGLGSAERAERVTVTWPSGRQQVFRDLPGGRWWRLHEGREQPEGVEPKAVRSGHHQGAEPALSGR